MFIGHNPRPIPLTAMLAQHHCQYLKLPLFHEIKRQAIIKTHQPKTNKIEANDGQLKLTIHNVQMIFQCEYWKCNKNF